MRNRGYSQHHRKHHLNDHQLQQQRDQLALNPCGAIFMCNNYTRKECFSRRIFGLPASREFFVRQVKKGMYLFLFNADNRQMYGVFKAASDGGMNIMSVAFSSSGTTYPAQVQFNIECLYKPLKEKEFKPAIWENYFGDVKFHFDLNSVQVQRLLALFESKKICRVCQPINDRWDLRSSTDSPLKWSCTNRQQEIMSNMNSLDQANLQVQITNFKPNTEGSELLVNSNMNFPTPASINLHQPVDPTAVSTRTLEIYHTHNPNDSTRQGIINASSLCLAQQQEPDENQTGTSTGNLTSQRRVSCLASNPSLPLQTQSLLCVNSNNQQVALAGYNPLILSSSQPVQFYASNPSYHGNNAMGCSMPSNFYSGSHLQGQFYNVAPQNDYCSNVSQAAGLVSVLKTSPLVGNPGSYQNPSTVSRFCSTKSGNQILENTNSDFIPNLEQGPNLSLKPTPNPNPTLYSDVQQRKSVFSRLSPREKHCSQAGGRVSVKQLSPGHLVQHLRHENGLNRTDKSDCKEWVVQDPVVDKSDCKEQTNLIHGLAGAADIEVCPDPVVMVDKIDVDPTAEVLNLNVVPDETVLLVDFKRRSGGNKLSPQVGGDKKKRRLIRPSLELENQDDDLLALKEHMHEVAMSSDKQSEQSFLVSTESVYNRENIVVTDAMDLESQVDSGNSENVLGPGCKPTAISLTDVSIKGPQHHHEGEMIIVSSIKMDRVKGNQDIERFQGPFYKNSQPKVSDSYFKAESLDSSTGESRYESSEMLVMMEIESQRQNNVLDDPLGPSGTTKNALETLSEKIAVDLEHVGKCISNGSQMILISRSEKLDTFELEVKSLSKECASSSAGQMESLVLGERAEKMRPVSSSQPVVSETKIEFKDKYVLEIEPDNLTLSAFLLKEAINLQEEYIPLEHEAGNLETGLLSLIEKSYQVEDYIALD